MACGTTRACGGSGCSNDNNDEDKDCATTTASSICNKCKLSEVVKSTGGLCKDCFSNSLFGKFRQAVTCHDLISATDNVLVAFSGGPSSRVALQFVHDLQYKAQRNLDASRDKSYPVFGVGVAFIDESLVTSIPTQDLDSAIQDLRLIVSSLAPPAKNLHIMPIQYVLTSDHKEGKTRLSELLDAVTDATGKEDLLHHLRILSLQKIACENKYNKLILGSSTSRIACHVLSATVKGQGYSLPADIQYVDARDEVPVVLPLRDCLAQELNLLCHMNGLKTLEVLDAPCSGINGLVSTFIKILQEENPARERTIVRTAEKLTPFHFNRLTETNDPSHKLTRRRKVNLEPYESISSKFLCPICNSPVNKVDMEQLDSKRMDCESDTARFGLSCCQSCQFQILPKELSFMARFYTRLPEPIIARAKDFISRDQTWLREQIKDCLLSDDEDGT